MDFRRYKFNRNRSHGGTLITDMKKIIIILLLTISVNTFSQLRPMNGYYAKITKDSIKTSDGVLVGSFFVVFDSISYVNISRLGWDQTISIKYDFEIYESYYRYRNHGKPVYFNGLAVHSIRVYNIDVLDGIMPETVFYNQMKSGLATYFGVNQNAIAMGNLIMQ